TLVTITEEDFEERVQAVLANPEDDGAALRLESAAQEGGDLVRIAETFARASDNSPETDAFAQENKKNLLFRSARSFESANDKQRAEEMYKRIVELDPTDDIAQNALLQVRRSLGKFDELVEMLLARTESASNRVEKGRLMADIGRI